MSTLGRLVATLGIDSADWVKGLTKAEYQMQQFQKSVSGGMQDAVKSLAGLAAAALSVGAAMEVFNKAVDYAASLDDLAYAAGTTVEKMDQMALSFGLIGLSAEQTGKMIINFEKSLVKAGEAGSKEQEIFAAMGVKIERMADGTVNAAKTLDNFTQQLAAIPDASLRTATAMAVLGKAGAEVAKNAGDIAKTAAMAQEQLKLYGPITDEMAAAAEDLGRQQKLLADAMQRAVAPAIVAIDKGMQDLRAAFNVIGPDIQSVAGTIGEGLVAAMKVAISIVSAVVTHFRVLGASLLFIGEALYALASGQGMAGLKIAWDTLGERTKSATDSFMKFNTTLWEGAPAQAEVAKQTNINAAAQAKLQAALNQSGKEAAKNAEHFRLMALALEQGVDEKTIAEIEKLNAVYNAGNMTYEKYSLLLDEIYDKDTKLIAAEKERIKQADALNKILAELEDAESKRIMGYVKTVEALEDANEKMKEEIALLGLVGVERDLEINRIERENSLKGVQSELARKRINDLYDERAALILTRNAGEQYVKNIDQMKGVLETIGNYGAQAFEALSHGLRSLSDFAKKTGDDLKRYLLAVLYEMAIKPFVITIAANIIGGTAQSAAGQMLGNAAGSVGTNALGSAAANYLFGGAGAAFSAGYAGASTAAATLGAGAAAEVGAAAAGTMGAGGLSAGLMAGAAAIPVAGWIALAGVAAYMAFDYFSHKGGGPKVQGYAEAGGHVGDLMSFGYLMENSLGQQVQPFVDAASTTFSAINTALGGSKEDKLALGIAIETDPEGTARGGIHTKATVGGKVVYETPAGAHSDFVGRSPEEQAAALKLESGRALLAALQASAGEFSDRVRDIVMAVDLLDATSEEIDSMLQLAGAVDAVEDAMAGLADPFKAAQDAIDQANMTSLEAWNEQRDALYDLADTIPATTDGLNTLAGATAEFYKSTVQLALQIIQAKQSIDASFESSRERFMAATRSPTEQYDWYVTQTDTLMDQLATETDPDKIAKLSAKIDGYINAAFDLLTPEEQAAMGEEFADRAQEAQDRADERFDAAMTTLQEQAQTDRQFISDKLDAILAGIQGAANTFDHGASTIDAAVGDGIDVNVTVDGVPAQVNG